MVGLLLGLAALLPGAEPAAVGRTFHEIDREIQDAFRRESQAASFAERADAVRDLAGLHREIVQDPRFATSPGLQEYRGKIAVRLLSVKSQLKRKLAHAAAKRTAGRAGGGRTAEDKAGAGEGGAVDGVGASVVEREQVISANLALVGYSLGGPVQALTRSPGARGGGFLDDGQTLVELIEATINPKFWDVNGGPGTIVYFAPLRCLVVRATEEVHRNVGGLAEALRDAGR